MGKAIDLEEGYGTTETQRVIAFDPGCVVSDGVVIRFAPLILEGCTRITDQREREQEVTIWSQAIEDRLAQEQPTAYLISQGSTRRPRPTCRKEISSRGLLDERSDRVAAGDIGSIVIFVTVRVDEIERVTWIRFDVKTSGEVITIYVACDVEAEARGVASVTGIGGIAGSRDQGKNIVLNEGIDGSDCVRTAHRVRNRNVQDIDRSYSSRTVAVGKDAIARVGQEDRFQRRSGLSLTETFVVEEEKCFVAPDAGTTFTKFR